MVRRLKPALALLFSLCLASPPAAAQDRREYYLADPTPGARWAFPEARCIWRRDHAGAMALVHRLERGMPAREIMPLVDRMSEACGWRRPGVRGDIIAAIVHLRGPMTERCLSRAAPRDYRRFRATIDKRSPEAPEVEAFIDQGFPAALSGAALRCDPALVGRATQTREGFWQDRFGNRTGR